MKKQKTILYNPEDLETPDNSEIKVGDLVRITHDCQSTHLWDKTGIVKTIARSDSGDPRRRLVSVEIEGHVRGPYYIYKFIKL